MNICWDSDTYTQKFHFVYDYGEDLLNLIDAPEGSLVIDLGCGNGALSKKIADMGYRVIGIDDSEDMLAKAREMFPDIEFRKGNAVDFTLEEKADVIFSNSLIHWIDGDLQQAFCDNVAANLKDGGRFISELGGRGCVEQIHGNLEKVFAEHGLVYPRTFYFPTIGEYAPIVENAGMRVVYAIFFDRPTPMEGDNGVIDFIHMYIKIPFEGMDPKLAEEMSAEAQELARPALYSKEDGWHADFVRLRFKAIKTDAAGNIPAQQKQ